MQKVLISSCLLGEKVRYDGQTKKIDSRLLTTWQAQGRLVALCPEIEGGLSVPRAAAEIQGDRVVNTAGNDVTQAFELGAYKALDLCKKHHIRIAILKEGSPSCGSSKINDGTFRSIKIAGQGVTAQLLIKHGINVFNEHQLRDVQRLMER